MKIYLDDIRSVPSGWHGAKNFEEFKVLVDAAIAKEEAIEAISFDNDLGEGEPEGHEILNWLAYTHPELLIDTVELSVHSDNAPERKRMSHDIGWYREHRQDLIEMKKRPDTGVEYAKLK